MWEWSPIRDWLSGVHHGRTGRLPLLLAVQTLIVMICIILTMAFYTLAERKVIGWIQARKGPNRIGGLFWIPGLGAAVCRRHQAHVQGNRHSGGRERVPVPPGAVPGAWCRRSPSGR